MQLPTVVSRNEWRAAREALLVQEKAVTRAEDALAARRRELPAVEVDKEYAFESPGGKATLADLFAGRRQLITYHFMWMDGPDEGCPSCSFLVDGIGDLIHLREHDTTLTLVSRGSVDSIERFRARMGWTHPWYSSRGSDFNADFEATRDGGDHPGISVFLRDGDRILHTYSTFYRGAEPLLLTYKLLDYTPTGRQKYITQFPHKDRYGK